MSEVLEVQEQSNLLSRIRESRLAQSLAVGGATMALAVGAEATIANPAEPTKPPVSTPSELPNTVTATFKSESATSVVAVSDIAADRVTILANYKAGGIPRGKHRKLEKAGACRTVDGKKEELWVKGIGANGKGSYGRDYRKSRFCMVNGVLTRVKCDNPAILRQPKRNAIPNKVIFVRSFAKANVNVRADAVAVSACEAGGASAFALGAGSATATARLKSFIRTRGQSAVKLYGDAYGIAHANAVAITHCENTTTTPPEDVKPPMTCDPNIDACATAARKDT